MNTYNYKNLPLFKQLYKLYKFATSNRYTIGIMDFSEDIVKNGYVPTVKWIKDDYKNGWFADPFILRVTDQEIIILVEEFVYKLNRGVISQLTINRNDYTIKDVKKIIDTGYHLSFPAYFRENGNVYIYPEQGERGGTWLYEYNEAKCEAKELNVINPNDTVDTTILSLPDGSKVLLCTTAPDYNGTVLDVYPFFLHNCPKSLNPLMKINSPNMTARNAGLCFRVGKKLYRPAQYCKNYYGEGVEIQEIIFIDGNVMLKPINILYSPSKEYPDAFHTFNVFDGKLVVVDGRKKRFPLIARILKKCL